MIVLLHKAGKVDELRHNGSTLDGFRGSSASETLLSLSRDYNSEILVWCETEQAASVNLKTIPELFPTGLEMISYGPSYLPGSIAYVEDSPFMSLSSDVRYPTWLMSTSVGAIKSETLRCMNPGKPQLDFGYFLTSLAKKGQRNGLLCYSEPRLLGDNAKTQKSISAGNQQLFRFVKQHYRSRWTLILLLSMMVFEKRFPIWAFVQALFTEKKDFMDVQLPVPGITQSAVKNRDIDVLIPTFGRPEYLKLVLDDLSRQDLLPKKVILIEQVEEAGLESQLDYLDNDWPFEIHHRLIYPPGACAARNIGLEEVESTRVFLADDDIRIPEGFLIEAVTFMEEYKAVAATFSCLREGEEEAVSDVIQWFTFGSGCSIVSADVTRNIRFDTAMEHGYGEDKEYGMQLRRAGFDVLYNPHLRLLHLKAPSGGFRKPVKKPWEGDEILPKPSPTIMYFKLKHATVRQLKGYKLKLFMKFYREQSVRNIFKYYRIFKKAWRSSVKWSKTLKPNQ